MTQPLNITELFRSVISHRKKYDNEVVVIKFGGELAKDDDVIRSIGEQAVFLTNSVHANVVIVHGGGVQIDELSRKEGLQPARDPVTDLRITDKATLDVSDRALSTLNNHIVDLFMQSTNNVDALGLAGYNGRVITALPLSHYTGEVERVNKDFFDHIFSSQFQEIIPVIYPICWNSDRRAVEHRLNVNADNVASAIAAQLGAKRLIMCTDVPGVKDKEGNIIKGISTDKVDTLIADGTVTGGMKTKLQAASQAADRMNHGGVVILDGREDGSILAELLSDEGIGTLVRRPEDIPDLNNPAYDPARKLEP